MIGGERLAQAEEFDVALDKRDFVERREIPGGGPCGGARSGAEIEQGRRLKVGK